MKSFREHLLTESVTFKIINRLEQDSAYNIEAWENNEKVGSVTIEEPVDKYYYFEDDMSEEKYDKIFPEEFATIQDLRVDTNHTEKGIGTQLMNKALDFIKNTMKVKIVFLNASPMDHKALSIEPLINFYKKFGFKVFLRKKDWTDNAYMILKLK